MLGVLFIAMARFSGHRGQREAWQRVEPNLKGVKLSPYNLVFLTHLQINPSLTLSKETNLEQLAFQLGPDQTVIVGLIPKQKPPLELEGALDKN